MPKYIRMDQSGENKKMKKIIKQMYPGIHFEMTARDTPQQNGKIERSIATISNRVRATLNLGGFLSSERNRIWAEAFSFCVDWQNVSVTDNKNKCTEEMWNDKLPKWTKQLKNLERWES